MSHKFTSDGRKVAIIGALNAKETIVQEIFVTDGTEFPAGEHFVVKTLLDAPAKTYKAAEEQRILDNIKRLEGEKNRLEAEVKGFKFKAQAATAKIKWIEGITDIELQEVFDNLKAMICGEYTHVVIPDYSGIAIKEWDEKLFSSHDDYNRERFDSLRLISLFGEWNGRLNLAWKVNTYRDGSGSSTSFFPCRSLQEAIEKAKEIIYAKEHLSDKDYEFCLKYAIHVDEVKNATRIAKKTDYIKQQIAVERERLSKLEDELAAVPCT
jgi:hypothetical protein